MRSNKNDSKKASFLLMLTGISKVIEHGAKKYGEGNWKESLNTDQHGEFLERLLNASIRHIIAEKIVDDDSGLYHIDHALTCLFMARRYIVRESYGEPNDDTTD